MDSSQTLQYGKKGLVMQIIPVMLCFFAMGFVDLVGTASNYVQKDLGLTDSQANLFPSLVFFWFRQLPDNRRGGQFHQSAPAQ